MLFRKYITFSGTAIYFSTHLSKRINAHIILNRLIVGPSVESINELLARVGSCGTYNKFGHLVISQGSLKGV
jgi:hypothetical protein